jgi:hypothetical protein
MNSLEPDALEIRRQNRLSRKRRYRGNLTDEARSQATQTDTLARQIARENLTDEARLQATQTNTSARQIERNLTSTQFDDHNRLLISRLHPHQVEAPTASQLLYPVDDNSS